jgi:hypothetical protein
MTALVMGHPMTKEVVGSSVTSDTSEMQVDSQTSDKGTYKRIKHNIRKLSEIMHQSKKCPRNAKTTEAKCLKNLCKSNMEL